MKQKYFTSYDKETWINKNTLIKNVKEMVELSIPTQYQKDFYELFFEYMNDCKYKN